MKKPFKLLMLILCLIFLLGTAGVSFAQTQTVIEPRAENFIFYVDNSGSMEFDYAPLEMKKSAVARDILQDITREVPEMEANYGVYTYGPYKEYKSSAEFNRQALADGFNAIPTDVEIFARQTPMGSGFQSLNNPVSSLQDRTAVIVVTDGESNIGSNPKNVLSDMYSRYGDKICFHFISLAQDPPAGTTSSDEQAFVDELAGLQPCSVKADASELANDNARADFINQVFYTTREVAAAPEPQPEPTVAPEPEPAEEVIVFNNITFDFDSVRIKPEFREILREAAQIFKERSETNVLLEGHTDNIGPAQYNMGLSQRRAQSVAEFLEEEGVSANRLQTKGYGLTAPRFNNDTREGRALNRRVEMRLE